jgi:hypothetical protein
MLPTPKTLSDEFRIRKKKKKKGFSSFASENLPESLLRAFWEKKSQVPELKEIETLRGSIKKIETLVAELKIVVNFRGVNNTFP